MFLPILECIVWHLVEVLQIVCYFNNPSSTGSQQNNPTKQDKNTASFPFSLSLSFSLLSRMSWSELSGLLKSFTFLKSGSPASPKKRKKTKQEEEGEEKEENKTTTNFQQKGFVAFEFAMEWRGGELVRSLLPMGKNPLLHLSRGFWICCGVFAFPVDGKKENHLLDLLWRF